MKLTIGLVLSSIFWFTSLEAKDFELTTAVNGVVKEIKVKSGQRVKQGQLLLLLDQKVFIAKMEQAKKLLHSTTLNKNEAEKELERAEELYERTVLSDHELNLAKVEFASADAKMAAAQSLLEQAAFNLEYSQILAPINGKVERINAWPGMVVNNSLSNTILLTIKK